ncbi:MAG: hypothetical protein ABI833_20690 [Acidobacteriota bacterium]
MNRLVLIVCCLGLAACSSGKSEAEKVAAAIKGDNAGKAADNRQSKFLTNVEAGSYMGEPVVRVENAAMGSGCMWSAASDTGSLLVQVVPADYHERPSAAPGYKELPKIDEKAFVVPEMGGWHAGSLRGEHAIHVQLGGKGASEARTVELLIEAMKRDAAIPDIKK